MNKYHARKTTVDGITFDSRAEARRYMDLCLLERAPIVRKRATVMRAFTAYEIAQAKARKLKGRPGVYAAKCGVRDAMTELLRKELGR